jgi:4'-phosphopantetheinyl transferase EntD
MSPTHICNILTLLRPEKNFTAAMSCSCLPLQQLIMSKESFLSRSEEKYFNKLVSKKRKKSYLLGRFVAKQAIRKLRPEIQAQHINIAWGVFNQPVIEHSESLQIQVSITHTQDCAIAIAFPEHHPIGVDLEDCNSSNAQAIKSQVSFEERSVLEQLELSSMQSIILLWSIKEALSKLLKTGLMTDFSLYGIVSSQRRQNLIISSFKFWHQYQALSVLLDKKAFSIVLPKKTTTNFSKLLPEFQNYVKNNSSTSE